MDPHVSDLGQPLRAEIPTMLLTVQELSHLVHKITQTSYPTSVVRAHVYHLREQLFDKGYTEMALNRQERYVLNKARSTGFKLDNRLAGVLLRLLQDRHDMPAKKKQKQKKQEQGPRPRTWVPPALSADEKARDVAVLLSVPETHQHGELGYYAKQAALYDCLPKPPVIIDKHTDT
jgi:hypothetical protein